MNAPRPNVSTDILQVRHTTIYRYGAPVAFGPHRAMFRPHESNDLRLTAFDITTNPVCEQHWVHDVFSNSKIILNFDGAPLSDTLEITCVFSVIRSSIYAPVFPIADIAQNYPFDYPGEQAIDLHALIKPEYDHAGETVKDWADSFLSQSHGNTWSVLTLINSAIRNNFEYRRREEPGIQAPRKTIELGHGSCRDFAVLMMEAVRQLGFAARFVTGYLYDPIASQSGALQGTGATHAWVQVFLPGAGWIEFDPTNGLIASGNLIRTGVARTPSQAIPLEGSFRGPKNAFTSMDVDVQILALAPTLYS